jgi:hypothetical protein
MVIGLTLYKRSEYIGNKMISSTAPKISSTRSKLKNITLNNIIHDMA